MLPIQWDFGIARGIRAGGDHDLIGGHIPHSVGVQHLQPQRVRIAKRSLCRDRFNVITLQRRTRHVNLMPNHMVGAIQQIAHRDVLLHGIALAINAALSITRKVQHRFAQGFAGDGARVDAHAADDGLTLNNRHALAQLDALYSRPLPGGARTNHDEVIFVVRHKLDCMDDLLRDKPDAYALYAARSLLIDKPNRHGTISALGACAGFMSL